MDLFSCWLESVVHVCNVPYSSREMCLTKSTENTVVWGELRVVSSLRLRSLLHGRIFDVLTRASSASLATKKAAMRIAAFQFHGRVGAVFFSLHFLPALLILLLGDVNHVGLRVQDAVKLNLFAFKVFHDRLIVEIVGGAADFLQHKLVAGLRDGAGKSLRGADRGLVGVIRAAVTRPGSCVGRGVGLLLILRVLRLGRVVGPWRILGLR